MARGQTPPRGSRPGQRPGPEGPPPCRPVRPAPAESSGRPGHCGGQGGHPGLSVSDHPSTVGPEHAYSLLPTGSLGQLLATPQCPHLDRWESALLMPLAGLRLRSHQNLRGLTGPSFLWAQPYQAPRPRANLLPVLGLCTLLDRHERLEQSQELRPWDLTCRFREWGQLWEGL